MLPNIQALRAISALMILLYHSLPICVGLYGDHILFSIYDKIGFVGVDVFFVISGFVITLTTTDKPRTLYSATHFLYNRAARIYLGYWPFLILMAIVCIIYEPAIINSSRALTKSIFLFPPHIKTGNAENSKQILSVAWSLTYEIYFYILFSFLFIVPKKYLPQCVIAFFIIIFLRCLYIPTKNHTHLAFYGSPFLLEFLGGSLLYHFRFYLLKKRHIFFALPGFLIGGYIAYQLNYELGFNRVLSYGASAFCLVWLFLILDTENIFKAGVYWSTLGDASYTLYLSHTMLLELFTFTGGRQWLHYQPVWLIHIGFVALIVTIILFSLQFYKIVEAPIYYKARKWV